MAWFFFFFFVSGFCSVLYELIWLRLSMAQFGVTTALTSMVLSVVHGWARSGLMAGRRSAAPLWPPPRHSSPSPLRASRTPHRDFRICRAPRTGLGTSSAGASYRDRGHVFGDVLSRFRSVAGGDHDSLVRLHGRDHSRRDVRHPLRCALP